MNVKPIKLRVNQKQRKACINGVCMMFGGILLRVISKDEFLKIGADALISLGSCTLLKSGITPEIIAEVQRRMEIQMMRRPRNANTRT